jgi:glycosyltransferase involved in cell wall biosynthesis
MDHPSATMQNEAPHGFLLSIITINKNNASGVSRTLDSLWCLQSEPLIEFLFIDGVSSDDSLQIATAFYRPACLVSEPDGGLYAAMNKGLRLASGVWLLWLNSGDELIPSCWPQLKRLLLDSTASVLCGASEIVDHTTGACDHVNPARPSDLPWGMVNHSSTFFRRQTTLLYHGYNECYRIAADRDLLVRFYLNHEPIEYTDLILSRFWLGGLSDHRLLERAKDNLKLDLATGLITPRAYRYGLIRHFLFLRLIRPVVRLLRRLLLGLGINLPPLGAFAGPLGELRRDAFAGRSHP